MFHSLTSFWGSDPAFFGERALRESDFFSDEEFMALPIAREVFLPSHAHRQMKAVIMQHGYALSISAHRTVGKPAFSDAERDRMQELRRHPLRSSTARRSNALRNRCRRPRS